MSQNLSILLLVFLVSVVAPQSVCAAEKQVTDELGYSFSLETNPVRVISLAPELTEIIYACGCGDKLVAASEYSDYPEAARKLPQIGSYARPDIEKIVSFAPDLIIGSASGNPERSISRLRELGLKVYVIFPRGVDGALRSLRGVSDLLGCGKQGKELADVLEFRFSSLKAWPVEKSLDAVILFNLEPPISSGSDTLSDDLLSWVGLRNILHRSVIRYPTVSLEWIVAEDPDFIFMAVQSGENNAAFFERFPDMQAVRKKQVIEVNPDLLSRAGPRLIEAAAIMRGALLNSRGKKP